jgi:hypothetical protein
MLHCIYQVMIRKNVALSESRVRLQVSLPELNRAWSASAYPSLGKEWGIGSPGNIPEIKGSGRKSVLRLRVSCSGLC